MLHFLDFVRELTFIGVFIRMFMAVVCGGVIGIERETKRRPAGFRTHILICLGASMTTLTSQYLFLNMHMYTDIARLGAQVVAGIGFIGAGTIIVTKHKRVKGLTTAAGLWTAAIIGLTCGAGYVECALFATVMVLGAESSLIRFEKRFTSKARDMALYVEYTKSECIEDMVKYFEAKNMNVYDMEISRIKDTNGEQKFCAILYVESGRKPVDANYVKDLLSDERVLCVEEM